MIKKKKNKIINFFKKTNYDYKFFCPDLKIFQILSYNKFRFKNTNILDLGFGQADNLIEFKRRGSQCYGVDIRKESVDRILYKKYFKKNSFKVVDLSDVNFDFFKKKFELIYSSDCFNYLNEESLINIFSRFKDHLRINGFVLFQYIQCQLSAKKKIKHFNYEINDKLFKVNKYFYPKNNPIRFIPENEIKNLIKVSGLHIISSVVDIYNDNINNFQDLLVNRYILLQNKN
jgi:hypothetical protein